VVNGRFHFAGLAYVQTMGEHMSLLLTAGQYRKKDIRFLSLSLDPIAVREYYLDEADLC
jgi:hypothetical protein